MRVFEDKRVIGPLYYRKVVEKLEGDASADTLAALRKELKTK